MKIKKLNEDFISNEQLQADGEDGWGDEIEETLEEVFDKMQSIQYEVNNCVRGSYGVDGDKVENLVSELEEVQDMLNDKIWYLKHQSDELNESKPAYQSRKYSKDSFDKAYEFLKDATDNFTKEGRFTLPEGISSAACEDILSHYYESSGLTGDSENPTYPEEVRAFKPTKTDTKEIEESFNDNWTQRFSGMNVFTNGRYQIKSVILANGQDGWELGRWNDSGRYNRIDVFTNIDKAKQKAYDLQYPLGERLNETSYGGAFDIADDQYFTREDLNDFAEEVLNRINEAFVTQFDVSACYIDDGVLELEVTNSEYGDYDWSEKIDMRKIKKPEDLNRNYASWFASQLINEITQSNNGLVESLNEVSDDKTLDIDKVVSKYEDAFYHKEDGIINCANENSCKAIAKELGIPKSKMVNSSVIHCIYLDESKSNLKENIEEDAITASRYLDFEIPEICKGVLDLIEHFPTHKLTYINKLCRDFYAKMESLIHSYTMEGDNYDESLTEDVDTEIKASPEEGPKFGLSSLLNDAIQEEFKTIDTYNSLAVTARDEGFEDIAVVVDEINTEENKHVGQLQALLKTIAPNAAAIDEGDIEAGKQLNVIGSLDDEDFDLATEFGISDDDDISEIEMQEALDEINKMDFKANNSTKTLNNINDVNIDNIEEEVVDMKEAWEDIYDSFKKIETDLNGDGEAITATIDRIYQDNKGNPDFKKAYDKWASGN